MCARGKREGWKYRCENKRGARNWIVKALPPEVQILIGRDRMTAEPHTCPPARIAPPANTMPAIVGEQSPASAGGLTKKMRDTALAKADLLNLYLGHMKGAAHGKKARARKEFMRMYNSGLAWPALFGDLGKLSWKTIEDWKVKVRHSGDTFALADTRGAWARGSCGVSDAELNVLVACALNPNRLYIAEAIRLAKGLMRKRGIPITYSDATYRRAICDWRDNHFPIWKFTREGEKAWNDEVAYYITRDRTLINVGDIIVADGHVLNFEILNPFTGKPKRMILILWYDMRSNMPLGWEIMPTENTAAISSALRRSILFLGKIPEVGLTDNGKAFSGRFFNGVNLEEAGLSGLYERLGMKTIFAWPYHGQSKPVEGFFKIFGELERWMPTYSGSSIENKPPRMMRGEKMHRRVWEKVMAGEFVTLSQAHRAIATWFDVYADRPQEGHLQGFTPREVFEAGRGPGVDEVKLRELMMAAEIRKVYQDGIHMFGRSQAPYYHPALYGRRRPVLVRYDLQERSEIHVYEPDGEFICTAEPAVGMHPAARHLGTPEDEDRLKLHIALKKRQEKEASVFARQSLETNVIPEHRRLLASMGITETGGQKAEVKALPVQMSKEQEAKMLARAEKQMAETEEMNRAAARREELAKEDEFAPYVEVEDENRHIFKRLEDMREPDKYETLLEVEARGVTLPRQVGGIHAVL